MVDKKAAAEEKKRKEAEEKARKDGAEPKRQNKLAEALRLNAANAVAEKVKW